MSRVAKAPINKPANVEIAISDDTVSVKGPKGSLSQQINRLVSVAPSKDNENQYIVTPVTPSKESWAQAGTARALINNMVVGVTDGFTKTLELVGVGYRAQAKGDAVSLTLGFSHPIEYKLPKGVSAETPNNTTLVLTSIDKQLLGQAAAEIRAFRPPEPYKGKGVKYSDEVIVRKEAKK